MDTYAECNNIYVTSQIKSGPNLNFDGSSASLSILDDSPTVRSSLIPVVLSDLLVLYRAFFYCCPCASIFFHSYLSLRIGKFVFVVSST